MDIVFWDTKEIQIERLRERTFDDLCVMIPLTKHKWVITNKRDVIGVDLYKEKLFINGEDMFEKAHTGIRNTIRSNILGRSKRKLDYRKSSEHTIVGENYIAVRAKTGIHTFRFDTTTNTFSKFQKIGNLLMLLSVKFIIEFYST